ncbi:MAG: PilT/PilU family type 4a pilus ATPase [Lentisphaeria bacterium]|nr:PilT/PilU family type 4a pilus ATPase [Lentisphaeria bacterium]
MTIPELLSYASNCGASDLFITANKAPSFRVSGELTGSEEEINTASEIDSFRRNHITPEAEDIYRKTGSVDAALSLETGERFRVNYLQTSFGPGMVARPIHSGNELYIETLGLPVVLGEICSEKDGLIIVSGTSRCGKSTTLGALVNQINMTENRHIVTLENPIEFIHMDQAGVVTQREVMNNDYASAIRSAQHESPDVIVVGELSSQEAIRAAIRAALNGHLVIAVVVAPDAVQALIRLVKSFPESEQQQIAFDLSQVLVSSMAQRLVPRIDGEGQVAAVELLRCTNAIKKLLAEKDFPAIRESLGRANSNGTVNFNKSLFYLVRDGFLDPALSLVFSDDPGDLELLIKGMDSESNEKQYGTPEDAAEGDVVDLPKLLRSAVKLGASDLHLSVNAHPMMRVHGELRPLGLPVLKDLDTKRLLFGLLTPQQKLSFEQNKELDLAIAVESGNLDDNGNPEMSRFRVNAYYQRGYVGVVARVITTKIPSPESLNLPQSIIDLCEKKQGMILVTGPTGSGKSTTLASLIDRINSTRPEHIITIEDPIEYVHSNKKSLIQQRELNADTMSFSRALKSALRQDPDVILVGEMRDTETIGAALTAAETGHLVMATLHTNSAAQTIDRIIDTFPPEQQNQVKLQLSGCIVGIISQRLLPRADADGRVAAFEILIGTPPIQALVRDGKTSQLTSVMETGFKDGMITMRRSLDELLAQGMIYEEDARALSLDAVEAGSCRQKW